MAEKVTMWKASNGKHFWTLEEAEQEDSAEEMIEVFNSLPDGAEGWTFETIARHLSDQGYRITNVNPVHASA